MESERLKKIIQENQRFEKKSPYNFCDRWCERCTSEKQLRCKLYQDELEQKMTCIAHGKDEDDPEMTQAVLEAQYEGLEEKLRESAQRLDIDLDNIDIDEDDFSEEQQIELEDLPEDVQRHIRFVESNPLDATAKQYCIKANTFLEQTFYKNEKADPELKYDFETLSWYHTLLEVKLHRALCGFHEPMAEGDISICDAVAQFQICLKAINESLAALRKVANYYPQHKNLIIELIAILNNIHSRITAILESI